MHNFKALKYWFPLFGALFFALGLWLGYVLCSARHDSSGDKKLRELFGYIHDNYVDEVDADSLVEMSIPAILSNLDPHSAYIAAKDLEEANLQLKGSFSGVGIQFQIFRDTVNVVEVTEGGPAEKAGLQPGDRIVTVDGKNFTGKDMTEDRVRETLRGARQSCVRLGIVRPGSGKTVQYTLTRGEIPLKSIETAYMVDKETGLIRVNNFGEQTYAEFLQALNALRVEGAKNYIVDLRGNTGGYMETAILMANEFLPAGKVIVSTRGRRTTDDIVLSDGTGAFSDFGLVVLIDEMSASSSEIFAGAMQDHDRALVLGRRSFGKGLVQRPISFEDGSELRLTVQRYYTPSGRSIQKEYRPGHNDDYGLELYNRIRSGELMNEDSIKLHKDLVFTTEHGREVYGGGGIVPDIFVPNDTSGVTNYYIDVANKGLLMKFAYEYCDLNRQDLSKAKSVSSLMGRLPSDDVLLSSFIYYATTQGVPARWYYIKLSRNLIVTQLKGLIARNVLGSPAYYEVVNATDNNVSRALSEIRNGNAAAPIKPKQKKSAKK